MEGHALRMQSIRRMFVASALGTIFGSLLSSVEAQVIQLPDQRKVTLKSSVLVPDGGATHLAGHRSIHNGRSAGSGLDSSGRSMSSTASASGSASGASVHATVIDLDELDRMIRCQVELSPDKLRLKSLEHGGGRSVATVARGKAGCNEPPPRYDYIMAMTHVEEPASVSKSNGDLDQARYYLQFADRAARKQQWNNAAFFYNLAWENLPEKRRTGAMKELLEARAARLAASQELAVTRHVASNRD